MDTQKPANTFKTESVSNTNLLLDIRNQDEIDSVKYNNRNSIRTYKTVLYTIQYHQIQSRFFI